MVKKHREPSTISEGSEKTISFLVNTEDRVSRLRRAYLDGLLTVDSKRLAEKILTFESRIETAFPDHKKN